MASYQQLMGRISSLRDKFTDFELVCGGQRFPVHRIIVCSQSKVLHAACTSPFKEATSGEYEIVEQSPANVQRMVDYLYTGNYDKDKHYHEDECGEEPDNDDESEDAAASLSVHARMFALADMYDLEGLQKLAAAKYGSVMATKASLQDLLASVPDVYQLTPSFVRDLRDRVVTAVRVKLGTKLGDNEEETDSLMEAYDDIADASPEFLKDLLRSYIRVPLLGKCYNCNLKDYVKDWEQHCLVCGVEGAQGLYYLREKRDLD